MCCCYVTAGPSDTVLTCVSKVAGTEFDLAKVRNPWGSGEFESGLWDDDGPGWEEHPEVKEALKPDLGVDDGVFWVSKEEFFKYFHTVYLSASDMTKFLEEPVVVATEGEEGVALAEAKAEAQEEPEVESDTASEPEAEAEAEPEPEVEAEAEPEPEEEAEPE